MRQPCDTHDLKGRELLEGASFYNTSSDSRLSLYHSFDILRKRLYFLQYTHTRLSELRNLRNRKAKS